MIDLDESNVKEKSNTNNLANIYKIGDPILTYKSKEVGKK